MLFVDLPNTNHQQATNIQIIYLFRIGMLDYRLISAFFYK